MEANQDKINWKFLSLNPAAIHLLVVAEQQSLCASRIVEANYEKIYWWNLSSNPAAIHLLVVAEQQSLCAKRIVEANPDKIDWDWLLENPGIFELDYNIDQFKEELIANVLHPQRVQRMMDQLRRSRIIVSWKTVLLKNKY